MDSISTFHKKMDKKRVRNTMDNFDDLRPLMSCSVGQLMEFAKNDEENKGLLNWYVLFLLTG